MSEPKEVQKTQLPSELVNPESQAAISKMISAAIQEVVGKVVAPIVQSMALTPEKLRQAEELRRMPDATSVARERRLRELTRQDAEQNRQNRENLQRACAHKYPSGQWSVSLVSNYPDRQPRGVCMLCQAFFQPRRWEIGNPDSENPRGRAFIAEEHPQYHIVREIAATKG